MGRTLLCPPTKGRNYFRRARRTALRKISHASRHFSYLDRFFLLPGYNFSDFTPSTTRTGNTYQASFGLA